MKPTGLALLAALLCSTAARADLSDTKYGRVVGWRSPSALDVGLHVVATGLVVTDCLLSLDIKNHWGYTESNPLLPKRPSDGLLVGACLGSIVLTTAAWYVLPPGLRWMLDGGVIGIEGFAVANNVSMGLNVKLPF